jgi:hypothetical protein
MIRLALVLSFIGLASCAAKPFDSDYYHSGGSSENGPTLSNEDAYPLSAELQIGHPFVNIKNPDSSKAYYDGVGVRFGLLQPIIDKVSWDVALSGGVKYLDLKNTANNDDQQEVANLIGPYAGLAIRWTRFWFGANYNQIWARHYATGQLSGRSEYNFNAIEYFGGVYFQFSRLGLGLQYSMMDSSVGKGNTGLNSDAPYKESFITIQFTFNIGQNLWQMIQSLF